MSQLDLFTELRHPGQPRLGKLHRNAKDTEIASAKAQVNIIGEKTTRLLKALVEAGSHGLIRREMTERADMDISSVCSCLASLVENGWAFETYRKRTHWKTKAQGRVFIATDAGRRVSQRRAS